MSVRKSDDALLAQIAVVTKFQESHDNSQTIKTMLPPFKRGEPPAHLFIEPKSDELERLRAKLAKMEAAGDVLADVLYMHIDVGHMKQSDAAIFQWKESKK